MWGFGFDGDEGVVRVGWWRPASFDEFDDPGEISISFGFGYLSANGIIL